MKSNIQNYSLGLVWFGLVLVRHRTWNCVGGSREAPMYHIDGPNTSEWDSPWAQIYWPFSKSCQYEPPFGMRSGYIVMTCPDCIPDRCLESLGYRRLWNQLRCRICGGEFKIFTTKVCGVGWLCILHFQELWRFWLLCCASDTVRVCQFCVACIKQCFQSMPQSSTPDPKPLTP